MKKIIFVFLFVWSCMILNSCSFVGAEKIGAEKVGIEEKNVTPKKTSKESNLLRQYNISNQIDEYDRLMMQKTVTSALELSPISIPVEWKNPDTGNKGYVVIIKNWKNAQGQYCREYKQIFVIKNQEIPELKKSCRNNNSKWVESL